MKDRKVIQALEQLNKYDLNSFSKFVHSPFFNVNKNITSYFDFINNALRHQETEYLTPEHLWNQIFTDQPYHNQKFLKLNSDLNRLLEDFLAHKELEDSLSFKLNFTVEGAKKRQLTNLYNSIVGSIQRLGQNEMNQSYEFYLSRYMQEKNLFSLRSENEKKNERSELDTQINIKEISDSLDYFYISEKLRQYCTLLSWKKMYKLDIPVSNMDFVLETAQKEPYASVPPISIYYKMYLTYEDEGNTENYYQLRNEINEYLHIFPIEEQKDIYSTLLSYCINKTNKNHESFYHELFEVYKSGLKNNILIVNQRLSVSDYRNIGFIALRIKEFIWAENFIYEYASYLDEKYRNNAVEFSLARLEFYRKNYGKVLEHLYKVNYEDVWYNINAKTLQIASYYELDEFDALESLLQSFRMFIRREKSLSASRKNHYLNLIKYTQALIRIYPKDKDKLRRLRDEISVTQGIVSKPWLLEKIDTLLA